MGQREHEVPNGDIKREIGDRKRNSKLSNDGVKCIGKRRLVKFVKEGKE